jgi:hypothetical protein
VSLGTTPSVTTLPGPCDYGSVGAGLQPAVLRREFVDGNITRHPESHYLDFFATFSLAPPT